MKLLSLLVGIWCIFGNCFDIFVKYCLVGVWSCVFKNSDFHISVQYTLSSCNTTCKCLHKHVISVFDIFWVTSKYSVYGLHGCDTLNSKRWIPIFLVKPCASIFRPDPKYAGAHPCHVHNWEGHHLNTNYCENLRTDTSKYFPLLYQHFLNLVN